LPKASDPEVLVDQHWAHWSIYANVGGPSAQGYGQLVDQGGGWFAYERVVPLRYSRLELYQQGLLAASDVGELFYVESATDFDPPASAFGPWTADAYGEEVRYRGTRVEFSIDDVIAAYGPREPHFAAAQTSFRVAFVLVCSEPAACSDSSLGFVESVRQAWGGAFSAATAGRASVDTALEGGGG
jgi:hypothetical protein